MSVMGMFHCAEVLIEIHVYVHADLQQNGMTKENKTWVNWLDNTLGKIKPSMLDLQLTTYFTLR